MISHPRICILPRPYRVPPLPRPTQTRVSLRAAWAVLLLAWLVLTAVFPQPGHAQQNDPDPTPGPGSGMGPNSMPDRLAPPPTVFPPSQADLGAQVFYQVCMACHGDRGQGLTDEWRQVLDPPDQNCWQSGCHAPNHPPGGFVFPRYVPSVISPGMVARFETASDLHKFIQEKMPWQAPGSRSEAEYWQLTAFLLRENGIEPGPGDLDDDRAAAIFMRARLTQPDTQPEAGKSWLWWSSAAAAGITFLILLVKYSRKVV